MKLIYEMIILDSGGEDVRLGEIIQPDCVSNQKVGDQANQILVVCARRIFGHHSIH